jgi:hypothetical protein
MSSGEVAYGEEGCTGDQYGECVGAEHEGGGNLPEEVCVGNPVVADAPLVRAPRA